MTVLELNKRLDGAEGDINLCINTAIQNAKLSVLFGESGAGKSTILKMIAGLLSPSAGKIIVDGETWFDSNQKINLPPQKRKVGFVFQDYALFPNMSVKQNLLYALDEGEIDKKVDEILELTQLTKLKDKTPDSLSGGQKQRVALARALVRKPKILLLDEPLSALDFAMRAKLQDELINIQNYFEVTTLLVSHDISEVYKMATEVIKLEKGAITAQGSPHEIFGSNNISGKFKFSGEIVSIEKSDIVYVVGILIGQDVIRVVATQEEVKALNVGKRVTVSSKAFNPVIIPA